MWFLKNRTQNTLPKCNTLLKNQNSKSAVHISDVDRCKSEGAASRTHAHGSDGKVPAERPLLLYKLQSNFSKC